MTDAIVFDSDGVRVHDTDDTATIAAAKAADGTTWVRAETSGDFEAVAEAFDLHALSVEDVRNDVRPKTEVFEEYTFVLGKTARLVPGQTAVEETVETVPLGVFIGPDWLVTLSPADIVAVDQVWHAVTREDARILSRGPDFAAYRVLDRLVDEYFGLLEALEERIEQIEDAVVSEVSTETLEELNAVRRELVAVRKLLWPMREAIGILARGTDHVDESTEKYYRDVYDHLVQLVDLTETFRDLAAGARDIYLNTLSMSTNEVMKKLTVVATIVLPLTLIAGIYGMNFGNSRYNMPELTWTFGYPAVMVGMGLVTVVLLAYFRREGWL